jgi:hypothetical protein
MLTQLGRRARRRARRRGVWICVFMGSGFAGGMRAADG